MGKAARFQKVARMVFCSIRVIFVFEMLTLSLILLSYKVSNMNTFRYDHCIAAMKTWYKGQSDRVQSLKPFHLQKTKFTLLPQYEL